jgi:fumarate reductase flavoprotein subunit
MSSPGVESLMLAAESVAVDVDLAQRLRCVQGETEASCVRRFLNATADALFRRPLEPAEAAVVAALAETGLPTDEAARFGLEVLLQSPQFLYLDPDAAGLAPGESRVSSPATVAARLARAPTARHTRADTIEGLAQALGLPEAALVRTLAAVEAVRASGVADSFGRVFAGTAPLAPPYCGVKVTGALYHTQGGLVVDPEARVLRPGGTPLPNLFAGGGAARGLSGPSRWGYLSGNGLLTATVLGRAAGTSAAHASRTPSKPPQL